MALFDSNCPKYFMMDERSEFETFLDNLECDYSVLLVDGNVVGCGGIHVNADTGEGRLCWGMVDQSHHRTGLGKALLEYRLAGIKADPNATHICIDTSQHTAPFFAKYGFIKTVHKKDGIGPGIDHVEMRLELTSS